MASVTLQTLWLNAGPAFADLMSFPTMNGLVSGQQDRAEVRAYANSRTRLVTKAGKPRSSTAKLPLLTRPQIAYLEKYAGTLVLARDAQGRKFYGAYLSPVFGEMGFIDEASTDITISELSFSEAV